MLIADYRVAATTYLLTHAAYSFRSLHRALLMVNKNSDPGNRKWETFGWLPPTLGPPSLAPNSGTTSDHTIPEISTDYATNSGSRLGVMLQNNAKQTQW